MMTFRLSSDPATGEDVLEVPPHLHGPPLIVNPMLNKGSAFPEEDRRSFGLAGLLPPHISGWQEQLGRTHAVFLAQTSDLDRHIYLRELQDRNEVLFYRLLSCNIAQMLPIVYTPTVGAACQHFSRIYRRPRGLFLAYPDRDRLDTLLDNRPFTDVDVIVVTDGERILGLGDQGVGGMGIPIGKLALYTLCGGIHPSRTLPIILDVGTDNEAVRSDPLYLGWRHPRVRGEDYDQFVEAFVRAVIRKLPHVLLQWEDFAQQNAGRLLERYRDRLCTFNDDIQGTAAVTLAALLAASRAAGLSLKEQRVVITGAGAAGTGVAAALLEALRHEGLSDAEARSRLWLTDRHGLLHSAMTDLTSFQRPFAQPAERLAGWPRDASGVIPLAEVVRRVRPTALLGLSGQAGLFTREIVVEMAAHVARPIVFPLSNPTARSEAVPADLVAWTDGRAIIATGSPFPPVTHDGRTVSVAQCNNAYVFPGVGLGVIACGARRVTTEMFTAAAHALADCSPTNADPQAALFPPWEQIRAVSRQVALAVAARAQEQGAAPRTSPEELQRRIDAHVWTPRYPRLVKAGQSR
jgi:malate dehydrogenase (oxaloacetate-decarboxylating)